MSNDKFITPKRVTVPFKPIHLSSNEALSKETLPSSKMLFRAAAEREIGKVIQYAWRCSLRALIFVFPNSTENEIWPQKATHHLYTLLRQIILIQNSINLSPSSQQTHEVNDVVEIPYGLDEYCSIPDINEHISSIVENQASFSKLIQAIKSLDNSFVDELNKTRAAISTTDSNYFPGAIYSSAAASAITYAVTSNNLLDICSYAADTCMYSLSAIEPEFQDAFLRSAILDFNEIYTASNALTHTPLWRTDSVFLNNRQSHFFSHLRNFKLEFLANDLKTIFEGRELESDRFSRYSTKISQEISDNAENLQNFLSGDLIAKDNPAVRVMLLGAGGAGKTSLKNLLYQRKTDIGLPPTLDIDHNEHKPIDLKAHNCLSNEKRLDELQLYVWDFGGQSIFYNLHRGFMRTENCVYILVVDSRSEHSSDEWLEQIRMYTNSHSRFKANSSSTAVPVLLVTNWYENIQAKQNFTRLIRKFPDLLNGDSFAELSCIDADEKFDIFLNKLVKISIESQYKISLETKNAMRITQELFVKQSYVSARDLKQHLKPNNAYEGTDVDSVIVSLDNLGQVVRLGNGQYCLNPNWIIEKAYDFINNRDLIDTDGIISLENFLESGSLPTEETYNLLAFLKKYTVLFEFPLNHEIYFLFPDCIRSVEPIWLAEFLVQPVNNNPIVIEYDFKFFPLGFWSQFIVQMIQHFGVTVVSRNGQLNVWKEGLFTQIESANSHLLIELIKSKKIIRISIFNKSLTYESLHELNRNLAQVERAIQRSINDFQFAFPMLKKGIGQIENLRPSNKTTEEVIDQIEKVRTLFRGISAYKQVSIDEVSSMTINYDKSTTNKFIDSPNSQQVSGDNAMLQSNVTESFNTNVTEKELCLEAIRHAIEFSNKESEKKIIRKVEFALRENQKNAKESNERKIIGWLWGKAKDVKDAVELGKMLAVAIDFLVSS